MAVKPDCPICGKDAHERYHPFCSKRCADLDLGRWLGGHYRFAALEPADEYELEAELAALDGGDGQAGGSGEGDA